METLAVYNISPWFFFSVLIVSSVIDYYFLFLVLAPHDRQGRIWTHGKVIAMVAASAKSDQNPIKMFDDFFFSGILIL